MLKLFDYFWFFFIVFFFESSLSLLVVLLFFEVVIEFLLILLFLPIMLCISDAHLQVEVDVWLFNLGLPRFNEQLELVV